jgi:hypothetical protein
MQMQMSSVLSAQSAIQKLQSKPMPLKITYNLTKLYKALSTEADFYNEKLNEIVQTYGERDEEGNLKPTADGRGVQIQKDRLEEAQSKLNELYTIEVTLPDIKLSVETLGDVELTLEETNALMPFFEE